MRVAVLAEWYPSPRDPVHGIWAHRQAVAVRDAGAEVRVIATRRPVPPLAVARRGPRPVAAWLGELPGLLAPWELDGIPILTAPFLSPPRPLSYGSWGWWMAPSVARALDRLHARWPFDVLHAHCVTPPGYAAARWVAARAGSGRAPALAVSSHGPDIISVHARSPVARRATRRALGAAGVVIANSRWAARRCEAIAGGPLPVEVVHLGADLPPAPGAGSAAASGAASGAAATAERRERPAIVTLGHLVARKRHIVVLHALAALPPETRPDYLIIGDGPGREPLARAVAELGLDARVRFLGQLPNREAVEEVARCQLFVMPSVEEPFGVAYVEAMAAGLPAIGARGEGGPEDIAAAGEGMTLVPPDDHRALAAAIAEHLRDPEALAARGRAARETVARHFTWEVCGRRTLAVYQRALEARGGVGEARP